MCELAQPSPDAYALAARYCANWRALGARQRRLLARDGHQVLGSDLASPAALVVCWTPDGDLDGSGPRSGGTGQALRIARALGIEVVNLCRPAHRARARRCLEAEPHACADTVRAASRERW